MSKDFDEAVALSAAMVDNFEKEIKSRYNVAPDDRGAVRVYGTLEEAKRSIHLLIPFVLYSGLWASAPLSPVW